MPLAGLPVYITKWYNKVILGHRVSDSIKDSKKDNKRNCGFNVRLGGFLSGVVFCSLLFIIDINLSWYYFFPLFIISQIQKNKVALSFLINILFWFIGHKYLWAVVFEFQITPENHHDFIKIQTITLVLYLSLAWLSFRLVESVFFLKKCPIVVTTGLWLLLLLIREITSDIQYIGITFRSFFLTYSWFQFYLLYALKDWRSIKDKTYAWSFIFPFWGLHPIPMSTGPRNMELADQNITCSNLIALQRSAIKMLHTVLFAGVFYLILERLVFGHQSWLSSMVKIPFLGWPTYPVGTHADASAVIPQSVLLLKFFGGPIHTVLLFVIAQGCGVAALRFMGYWNPRGVYRLQHVQSVRDLFPRLQFYVNYFLLHCIAYPIFRLFKIARKNKLIRNISIFFIVFVGALVAHFTCDIFLLNSFSLLGALLYFENGLIYFFVLALLIAISAHRKVVKLNQFCWHRSLIVFVIYCILRNWAMLTRHGGATVAELIKYMAAVFIGMKI